MNSQLKAGVFNKIIRALSQRENISEIVKNDDDKYSFSCNICGKIKFWFILRIDREFLVLKSQSGPISLSGNESITEFGSEIVEDTDVVFSSFEDHEQQFMVFQLIFVLDADADGVDAQKQVFNKTMSFVQLMAKNKDRLGCEDEHFNIDGLDFTDEAEDDPYGFNDFSDDDFEVGESVGVAGDTNFGEVVSADSGMPIALDIPSTDNDVLTSNDSESPTDIFTDTVFPPTDESNNGSMENPLDIFPEPVVPEEQTTGMPVVKTEKDTILDANSGDDVAQMLAAIALKREAREQRRKSRHKIPDKVSKSADEPQSGDENLDVETVEADEKNGDIFDIQALDIFPNDSGEAEQSVISGYIDAEIPETDMTDILSSFVSGDTELLAPATKPGKKDKEKKMENSENGNKKPKKHKDSRNGSADNAESNRDNRNDSKEDTVLGNNAGQTDRMVDYGRAPEGYKRAPEVVEQMKHLYDEMDQVFQRRKEQADYREKGLDDFRDRLDKKEQELNIREQRLDKAYEDGKKDIDKRILEMETQTQELKFQWKKLDSEKEMFETERRNLEEEKEIFAKSKEMDEKASVSDDRMVLLTEEMAKKDRELETLRERFAITQKELEEQANELRMQIQEMKDARMSEDDKVEYETRINSLNEQITELTGTNDDMKAEIGDLNEDISDLMEENSQQGKIIETLQEQMTASKGREAALVKEKDEMEKRLAQANKQAKALPNPQEVSKLQDELDVATMKIKELEHELSQKGTDAGNSSAEVTRLQQELKQAKEDLKKADAVYAEEKKHREDAEAMLASGGTTTEDLTAKAGKIKNNLADIGINVELVPANNELILSGFHEKSQVVVNVGAGIIYVEKKVKRGIKYRQTFEKWNNEDIRTSYLFSDNCIICKCAYEDVSKAAMDIIGRFSDKG